MNGVREAEELEFEVKHSQELFCLLLAGAGESDKSFVIDWLFFVFKGFKSSASDLLDFIFVPVDCDFLKELFYVDGICPTARICSSSGRETRGVGSTGTVGSSVTVGKACEFGQIARLVLHGSSCTQVWVRRQFNCYGRPIVLFGAWELLSVRMGHSSAFLNSSP